MKNTHLNTGLNNYKFEPQVAACHNESSLFCNLILHSSAFMYSYNNELIHNTISRIKIAQLDRPTFNLRQLITMKPCPVQKWYLNIWILYRGGCRRSKFDTKRNIFFHIFCLLIIILRLSGINCNIHSQNSRSLILIELLLFSTEEPRKQQKEELRNLHSSPNYITATKLRK